MKKLKVIKNQAQYLPLYNLKGLKSSITPFFGGDIKLDHHHYLLEPTTEKDLYANIMSRNMIFTINEQMYFLNGQTHLQQADTVDVYFGLMYQKVMRKNKLFTLETLSFIPLEDNLELLSVSLCNTSNETIEVDVITSIPMYGRSADNIRDHRHVTSLLNRVFVEDGMVLLEPTLSFDERGHQKNDKTYVIGAFNENLKPNRYITRLEDFLNGGSFTFPKGIYQTDTLVKDGYETIAGIGFEKLKLKPGESTNFIVTMGIFDDSLEAKTVTKKYSSVEQVEKAFGQMKDYFEGESEKFKIEMVSKDVSLLLKWVRIQPVLRRIFGNSYLPHHDYGRGGRGWRDLWQDLLSLILLNDESVKDSLLNNFQGVRIDGSNATIIGNKAGEFIADRNKIVRVWSDHGAWPLLTTLSYIDTTGDIDILFDQQTYFNDQFSHYTNKVKLKEQNNNVLFNKDKPYKGTILEHLLLQNIVGFLNTGKFGFTKLENADWNDGLDMAKAHGETIAFTHFYVNNLLKLSQIITHTNKPIYLFKSLYDLIFGHITLDTYFDQVVDFNEDLIKVDKKSLSLRLKKLYEEKLKHIKKHAWIENSHLQSYVTNDQTYLDNIDSMNLTGQAMALLNETLTPTEAYQVAHKTKELLFNEQIGGYHLNTNYQKLLLNMGRAYGFSYNHKENGAIFSHMAIMHVYGLYNYNLVKLGNEGYKALINRAINPNSHTILGIPEYFTEEGIGKYLYLTGSASWLLKLLQEQVFGIKFNLGKLHLEPKLSKDDFINGYASIQTFIHKKLIKVTYINHKSLDYGEYKITSIVSNGTILDMNDLKITEDIEVYLDEL